MKKIALIIAVTLLMSLNPLMAQTRRGEKKIAIERPDMEQIKREVNDPKSKFYYPRLMEMFQRNDTVMTLPQFRYLYLGTVFQEDYNPYRHNATDAKLQDLYQLHSHTRAQLDSIIYHAEQALADDPFDLTQMSYLIYALDKRGKVNKAAIWQFRLNHLLEAIVSTGTGADTDNAWYVINPRHEYNIINFLGNVATGQQYVEPYFDYISISSQNSKSPEGYFFNIKNLLEEYYRKHPE